MTTDGIQITKEPLIELHAYTRILTDIDNEKLTQQILNDATPVDPNLDLHYNQNPHHTYYEDVLLPATPELAQLEEAIKHTIYNITGKPYNITELWSITTEPGQSIVAHNHKLNTHLHPQEYYSFAYYPYAPEGSADLQFQINYCNTIEQYVNITAETGKLVIFNAYLTHLTQRQHSNAKRVNISGNLAPQHPNTEPTNDWTPYHAKPDTPTKQSQSHLIRQNDACFTTPAPTKTLLPHAYISNSVTPEDMYEL